MISWGTGAVMEAELGIQGWVICLSRALGGKPQAWAEGRKKEGGRREVVRGKGGAVSGLAT